jgi:CheY-like chemotaxis protein
MTKILVIDDDPMPRAIIKTLFEEDNYEVLEAADGVEGLEMATQHLPQLIITDMMMSKMNGLQFIGALKQQDAIKHIPIIVSSAKKSTEDALQCLKAGATEYIPKPMDLIAFRRRVKEILGHPPA